MSYLIGIDGGGTRTTVAVADAGGREVLRRTGTAGLVDPRAPVAAAAMLIALVHEAVREAGVSGPAAALCAGLAGVGNAVERDAVRARLQHSTIAERVVVVSDGEIALEGAFRGGPGILLIAGTGSIAYGRGEDGRTERCGGWGMIVGDEGSGYAIGRAALAAALRCADGRGKQTVLLAELLERLRLSSPREIPPWAGRAAKHEIAALVPQVVRLAESGDGVASEIVRDAAREQALHAVALADRLAPWRTEPPVVFFGGVFGSALFRELVAGSMDGRIPGGFQVQDAAEDGVGGAVRIAAGLVRGGAGA
jgi:glucosamine kinase